MTSELDYDVDQLSDMFMEFVGHWSQFWNPKGMQCKFSNRVHPKITYRDYLKRLMSFADCSKECWIVVLIYLERISKLNYCLDSASVYTLTLVAMVLSIKYMEDWFHSNDYYARLGGISLQLINELELEFLLLLDFNLYV